MKPIRNSAKAVIIKENKILLIQNTDENGYWYTLPGGGQCHGETLTDALLRECGEELGANVTVGNLIFVREYIGKNHEFSTFDYDQHQVELMFECFLETNYELTNGGVPDENQVGVVWIDLKELKKHRLYPKVLIKYLSGYKEMKLPIYFGDVN